MLLIASVSLSMLLVPIEIGFISRFSSILEYAFSSAYSFDVKRQEALGLVTFIVVLFSLKVASNCLIAVITYDFSTSLEKCINDKIVFDDLETLNAKGGDFYRSLLLTDVNNVVGGVVKPLITSVVAYLTIIPILIYIMLVSPVMLFLTLAITALVSLATSILERPYKISDSQAINKLPHITSKRLDELIDNPEIVKITGKSSFIYKSLEEAQKKYRFAIARNLALTANSRPTIELSCYLSIVVYVFFILDPSSDVKILEFVVGSSRIVGPIGAILGARKTLSAYKSSASKFADELRTPC